MAALSPESSPDAGRSLHERLAIVRDRIRTGRPASEVRIVAVTKGHPVGVVSEAAAAGLHDLGENYAQELSKKASAAPADIRWHFLGPVQRNKVKTIAAHVSLWHGIDRDAAGAEVARHCAAPMLVQVNLSGDPGRPGSSWEEAPGLVDGLRDRGFEIRGLMGVASRDPAAAVARQQFRRLAKLARKLELDELSMGMSYDLETAVEEGATIVRLGTALFGARPGGAEVRR